MSALETQLVALVRDLVAAEVERQLAAAAKPPAEFLSTAAAAELAGVASGTVRRWIREGRLTEHRAGRVVRVKRADVEKLLGGGRRKPAALTPEQRALRDFGGGR